MSKNIITSKITPEEHFFNSLRRFPNIRLSILKSSYILQDEDAIAMIKTNNTRSSTITKPTSPPSASSLIENKNKISTSKMNKTSLYNYYSNSKKMNLLKSIELSKKLNDLKGSCLEDVEQHLLPIRSRIRKKHIQVKQNNLDIYNKNINNIIIKNRDNDEKDSVIIYDDSMNVLNNNNNYITSSTSTKKHIVKSKVTFIDPTSKAAATAATTMKIHDDIYKNINNDDHDYMTIVNIPPFTPLPIKKALKTYTSYTDGGGGGGANPATITTTTRATTPTIQAVTATHKRSSRSNRSSKGNHKNSKLINNSTIIINNDDNLNNKHFAKINTSPTNENDYNNDHKNHPNHTLNKKSWNDLCKKLTKCGIKFKSIDDLIDCGLIEILDIMKYTKPTINDLDIQFELNLGLKLTDEQLLLLYKLLFPTTISVIHQQSDFLISSLT